jgi:hypothetical protein
MKKVFSICVLSLFFSTQSSANFFDDLVDAVEKSAKNTATNMAADAASGMIRDMFIGYSAEQTKTDTQVSKEYEQENGSLPVNTTVSSYKTRMLPGSAVSPGTKVTVKSSIEVIPGRNGKQAKIEEQLTIFDNEDNSLVLKSMTKSAGKSSSKGGQFAGEFTFTLPEGLPQGMYPIRSTLLLNGELAGDQDHQLQLVMRIDELDEKQMIAIVDINH